MYESPPGELYITITSLGPRQNIITLSPFFSQLTYQTNNVFVVSAAPAVVDCEFQKKKCFEKKNEGSPHPYFKGCALVTEFGPRSAEPNKPRGRCAFFWAAKKLCGSVVVVWTRYPGIARPTRLEWNLNGC